VSIVSWSGERTLPVPGPASSESNKTVFPSLWLASCSATGPIARMSEPRKPIISIWPIFCSRVASTGLGVAVGCGEGANTVGDTAGVGLTAGAMTIPSVSVRDVDLAQAAADAASIAVAAPRNLRLGMRFT
jgi:hypothetical protein